MPVMQGSYTAALDRKIRLQARSGVRSATTGALLDQWATYDTVWGAIEEATSSRAPDERADGELTIYGRPTTIRIRWRAGVSTEHRLIYAEGGVDRVMQIVGTAAVGRGRWLVLAVREWSHE